VFHDSTLFLTSVQLSRLSCVVTAGWAATDEELTEGRAPACELLLDDSKAWLSSSSDERIWTTSAIKAFF